MEVREILTENSTKLCVMACPGLPSSVASLNAVADRATPTAEATASRSSVADINVGSHCF